MTIKYDFIHHSSLLPEKLDLSKIETIKTIGKYIVIESGKDKIRINTKLIDKNSLKELHQTLALYTNHDQCKNPYLPTGICTLTELSGL